MAGGTTQLLKSEQALPTEGLLKVNAYSRLSRTITILRSIIISTTKHSPILSTTVFGAFNSCVKWAVLLALLFYTLNGIVDYLKKRNSLQASASMQMYKAKSS